MSFSVAGCGRVCVSVWKYTFNERETKGVKEKVAWMEFTKFVCLLIRYLIIKFIFRTERIVIVHQ